MLLLFIFWGYVNFELGLIFRFLFVYLEYICYLEGEINRVRL